MNIITSVASGRRAGSEVAAPEDDRILRLLPVASSAHVRQWRRLAVGLGASPHVDQPRGITNDRR